MQNDQVQDININETTSSLPIVNVSSCKMESNNHTTYNRKDIKESIQKTNDYRKHKRQSHERKDNHLHQKEQLNEVRRHIHALQLEYAKLKHIYDAHVVALSLVGLRHEKEYFPSAGYLPSGAIELLLALTSNTCDHELTRDIFTLSPRSSRREHHRINAQRSKQWTKFLLKNSQRVVRDLHHRNKNLSERVTTLIIAIYGSKRVLASFYEDADQPKVVT